MMILEISET